MLKRTKTEKQEAGKSVSTSEAGRGGRLGTCGASAMVELHCVCISSGSDSSPRQMLTGQTSSQVWKSDFFFFLISTLSISSFQILLPNQNQKHWLCLLGSYCDSELTDAHGNGHKGKVLTVEGICFTFQLHQVQCKQSLHNSILPSFHDAIAQENSWAMET